MKQIIIIIVTAMLALCPTTASAQKGLIIDRLFDGNLVPDDQMEETYVKGADLKKYKLTLFRSLKMQCTKSQADAVTAVVSADHINTFAKEEKNEGQASVYKFYQYPSKNGTNRFAIFQRNGNECKIVYIEGKATADELKKMFKKK